MAVADRKKLSILGYEFLEDRRGNRLPVTIPYAPAGFNRRKRYGWWVTDDAGYRLAVLRRPAESKEEAELVAEELCRRHGWRR